MGIGGDSVFCVAVPWGLVGVPWGLAGRAWSGWRCAVVIGGEALCHGVRWGERGLGGAVPW